MYAYDALNRLTLVRTSDGGVLKFTYDLAGNIMERKAGMEAVSSRFSQNEGITLYFGLSENPTGGGGASAVKLIVSLQGAFTGSLTSHGVPYPLQGTFVPADSGLFIWNSIIHRTGLPDLNVSLQYDPKDPSGAITGTLSDNTDSAAINLGRAGFDAKHPTALAGNYTVVLPANPDFPGGGFPQGDGYALLTVNVDGSVRLVGRLGDGTAVSQSGALSADGRLAVYLPLYGGRGALSGRVNFQPVDDVSDFNGTLHWNKLAAAGGSLYATGFDLEVDFMGSRFLPPVAGHRILNLENRTGNGVLLLGEGNLDSALNFAATLDRANIVQTSAPAATAFKMTIAPASGLFAGTFIHPGTKKTTAFSGVVFQKQNLATGVFAGSSKSGYVSLRRDSLSLLLLPPTGLATPVAAPVPNPYLTASWPFNQGLATDATGHGYDGTAQNTVAAADRHGSTNSALQFDGSSSSVNIATSFAMQNQQTFTAWINPSANNISQAIFEKAIPGYGGELELDLYVNGSGNVHLEVNTDDGATGLISQVTGTSVVPAGQWTHVAAVIDKANDQVLLYVNGNLAGTDSMGGRSVRNRDYGFRIGRRIGNQAWMYFSGIIDDVAVYDTALTAAEVAAAASN